MMQMYKNIFYNLHKARILLVILLTSVALTTRAQNATVLIDDNKISIEQVFRKIEQQTGYSFAANRSTIDLSRRVELPRARASLNEMLSAILKDTGCGYKIIGKSIYIIKNQQPEVASNLNFDTKTTTPIATHTIKGIVVDDETGRSLMGAKVSVSGVLGKEVETDHAGQFTIKNVPEGAQRIRTYLDGYYLSERGVQVSGNTEEIRIPLKTPSINMGSIRSDADKGGIVTAETSQDAANAIAPMLSSSIDTVAVEIPVLTTMESEIVSPYLNGIDRHNTKLGIKTNLLYLATTSPNIGIEWAMGIKWTVEVTAGFNMFKHREMFEKGGNTIFNHWLIKPEVRYWTCRAFDGHFFGVHGLVGQFRVSELPFNLPWTFDKGFPKNHEYQGWAYGGGITYGYQWAIGKRWNLEASIGVGYVRFIYDDLTIHGDCTTCSSRNKSKDYFGPTKAGLSLIYTF